MDRLFVQVKLENKKWKDIKWKLMKSCKQLKLDWRERNKNAARRTWAGLHIKDFIHGFSR